MILIYFSSSSLQLPSFARRIYSLSLKKDALNEGSITSKAMEIAAVGECMEGRSILSDAQSALNRFNTLRNPLIS